MKIRITSFTVVLAIGCVLLTASTSQAQFGGLPQYLFRAGPYIGNQAYISNPQGGPLYNYNLYSQRLEHNVLGQGYTFENYRFFGPDSFGNANTLDLGPFKVQLGEDPALLASGQPLGVHNKIGYTTTLIPEVFFEMQTGQRNYNQFSGVSNFAQAPVKYDITLNTGVQDFSWTGNALIDTSGRINAMGFYDFKLRFLNVGDYTASGMLLHDEKPTDFEIGPINVSGNIGLDALSGLLQNVGDTAGAVTPRVISGAASKDKHTEELLAKLQAGGTLTDEEMQYLAQAMIQTAFETDPLGFLTNGLPKTIPGFEGLTLDMLAAPSSDGDTASTSTVPEPGTLAFLGIVLGLSAVLGDVRRRWDIHFPGRRLPG